MWSIRTVSATPGVPWRSRRDGTRWSYWWRYCRSQLTAVWWHSANRIGVENSQMFEVISIGLGLEPGVGVLPDPTAERRLGAVEGAVLVGVQFRVRLPLSLDEHGAAHGAGVWPEERPLSASVRYPRSVDLGGRETSMVGRHAVGSAVIGVRPLR